MFEQNRTLHRYVIREFLKIFSLSLSSLLLIYIVVLFFTKMGQFFEKKAINLIFLYILYNIPEVIFQFTLPYAVLLATLHPGNAVPAQRNHCHESRGGSLYRITLPLIFIVFCISLCSFLGISILSRSPIRRVAIFSKFE